MQLALPRACQLGPAAVCPETGEGPDLPSTRAAQSEQSRTSARQSDFFGHLLIIDLYNTYMYMHGCCTIGVP